jgi:predicted TIM-barrel fold metal-dependent hydrolase
LKPCCQIFLDAERSSISGASAASHQDKLSQNPTRQEVIEYVRQNNGFGWQSESAVSSNPHEITHLELLGKFDIPYINDIHTHFFPEHVLKLIWRWFRGVNWPITYQGKETERIHFLSQNKVNKYTTLCYAHKKNMASDLNNWVFSEHKNNEQAILFGTFFPEEGAHSYVQKAVEEFQFKGFKLHCEVSHLNLTDEELKETFNYLQKKKIPLVIHTGTAPLPGEFTGMKYFEPFIQKYPQLKIIVAHMGTYEIEDYMNLAITFENIYLDTTMVFVDFMATQPKIEDYIDKIELISDKVLFGSDFPNIPYNYSHPVENILTSELSKDTKQNILYRNFENFFSLSQRIVY